MYDEVPIANHHLVNRLLQQNRLKTARARQRKEPPLPSGYRRMDNGMVVRYFPTKKVLAICGVAAVTEEPFWRHSDEGGILYLFRDAFAHACNDVTREISARIDHDDGRILARCDSSLFLDETPRGLEFTVLPPRAGSPYASDFTWAVSQIRAGRCNGCSFGWYTRTSVTKTFQTSEGPLCQVAYADIFEVSLLFGNREPANPSTAGTVRLVDWEVSL